ncbi:MAG: D-amino acid aminotransferase [Rhodobiaceae bacterium]|nr:D-amino acid aminotransferase [Rhodobiaceae bacterium]|tara:strand:- start:957 stop:1817 length:861 start_codon:yes stop_codon:yes gene_type:complete
MVEIAYVNGSFVEMNDARVSVKDRGLLFGDGVYEVAGVFKGILIDNDAHLERLKRSLQEIKLELPMSFDQLEELQKKIIDLNKIKEGTLYLHVTRGASESRDFEFPKEQQPSVVMFTQHKKIMNLAMDKLKAKVLTYPDLRWKRRDIKSIALLAQVLAKEIAHQAGCNEVWMHEDGFVTEGGSSNAFIIKDHKLISRKNNETILSGITRQAVLKLIEQEDLVFEERPFTIEEAYEASEAFYTSASVFVMPVISIDKKIIGNGEPGALTLKLRNLYENFAKSFINQS